MENLRKNWFHSNSYYENYTKVVTSGLAATVYAASSLLYAERGLWNQASLLVSVGIFHLLDSIIRSKNKYYGSDDEDPGGGFGEGPQDPTPTPPTPTHGRSIPVQPIEWLVIKDTRKEKEPVDLQKP